MKNETIKATDLLKIVSFDFSLNFDPEFFA